MFLSMTYVQGQRSGAAQHSPPHRAGHPRREEPEYVLGMLSSRHPSSRCSPSERSTTMSRTYVVTGSASGIGKATKELLEERGEKVIGVDIHDADVVVDLCTASGRTELVEKVSAVRCLSAGVAHQRGERTSLRADRVHRRRVRRGDSRRQHLVTPGRAAVRTDPAPPPSGSPAPSIQRPAERPQRP